VRVKVIQRDLLEATTQSCYDLVPSMTGLGIEASGAEPFNLDFDRASQNERYPTEGHG
jgi:hypothetical protein